MRTIRTIITIITMRTIRNSESVKEVTQYIIRCKGFQRARLGGVNITKRDVVGVSLCAYYKLKVLLA